MFGSVEETQPSEALTKGREQVKHWLSQTPKPLPVMSFKDRQFAQQLAVEEQSRIAAVANEKLERIQAIDAEKRERAQDLKEIWSKMSFLEQELLKCQPTPTLTDLKPSAAAQGPRTGYDSEVEEFRKRLETVEQVVEMQLSRMDDVILKSLTSTQEVLPTHSSNGGVRKSISTPVLPTLLSSSRSQSRRTPGKSKVVRWQDEQADPELSEKGTAPVTPPGYLEDSGHDIEEFSKRLDALALEGKTQLSCTEAAVTEYFEAGSLQNQSKCASQRFQSLVANSPFKQQPSGELLHRCDDDNRSLMAAEVQPPFENIGDLDFSVATRN